MAVIMTLGLAHAGSKNNSAATQSVATSGTISLKVPGDMSRPAVQFPHERHVASLGAEKSCQTCHTATEAGLSFIYINHQDLSPVAARDTWHQQCLGCHQSLVKAGQPTGSLTCGGCHIRNLPPIETPRPAAFYDTYHELHESLEGGCGLCHHAYDEQAAALYYEPGTEESCWGCHGDESHKTETTPSLREASHLSCVNCHVTEALQENSAAPIDCGGCHNTSE